MHAYIIGWCMYGVIGCKWFSVGVKCFLLESNEKYITEDEGTSEREIVAIIV